MTHDPDPPKPVPYRNWLRPLAPHREDQMSTTDQLALLRANDTVERLDTERALHPGDQQRERTYLLHRAAVADRAVPTLQHVEPTDVSEQDAEATAHRLLEYDRTHDTGHGPVPATDARWDQHPRGYVHQEHAAAVRDEHETEQPSA